MDKLKLFRGGDYTICKGLCVRQPTVGEVCEYGEQQYLTLVRGLCATPADRKVEIWDTMHKYWEDVNEYDLFISTFPALCSADMSIILPGLDCTSFEIRVHPQTKELILRNADGVVLDRAGYYLLTEYLRTVHRFKKNVVRCYNNVTRDAKIEDDRLDMQTYGKKPFQSVLIPLISSVVNYGGTNYRYDDVWSLHIGELFDSVERIRKYETYKNLMIGIYTGNVDTKKVKRKELDWMGES